MKSLPVAKHLFPSPGVSTTEEGNIQRGWKSDIARRLDVNRSRVTNVLRGRSTSARIARAIVEATGKTHAELWPGKYPEAEFLEAMAAHKPAELDAAKRSLGMATGAVK